MQTGVTRFGSAVSGSADAAISLSTDMIIDSSGNVGIGTSTLGSSNKLTLYHGDDTSYAALALQSDHTSTGNSNGSWLGIDQTSAMGLYVWNYEAAPLRFGTSSVERMHIESGGNVGIGTINPTALLHINKLTATATNVGYDGAELLLTGKGWDTNLGGYDHGWKFSTPTVGYSSGTGSSNSHLVFNQLAADGGSGSASPAYIERMRIDALGNVGIGITSLPDVTATGVKLAVKGPIMSGKAQGFAVNAAATGAQNIRDWFVFCGPGTNSSGNYVHMKTNLANTSANAAYTMSCFTYHGYYAYGGSTTPGGYIGWHNWSGSFYNVQRINSGTLQLVQPSYVSSDGYVVLVALTGTGYAQFSIDWHQWAGYPFRTAKVTATAMSTSATGAY
jgi:hypothetical protein